MIGCHKNSIHATQDQVSLSSSFQTVFGNRNLSERCEAKVHICPAINLYITVILEDSRIKHLIKKCEELNGHGPLHFSKTNN
jgi:hypothetical protein